MKIFRFAWRAFWKGLHFIFKIMFNIMHYCAQCFLYLEAFSFALSVGDSGIDAVKEIRDFSNPNKRVHRDTTSESGGL
jgi:hypothetical protein